MPASVEQLVTPISKEQALQTLIDILTGLDGGAASAWQSGSMQRTMFEVCAVMFSDFTTTIKEITEAGFNDTSFDDWLTLLSESLFRNYREAGRKTQGTLVLEAEAGAPGPFTIDTGANQIVVSDTINGFTYRNITGGTLNAGSSLEVTIEAETIGANRDVVPNTITVINTPLAGVTCNNPAIAGETTWITQSGADAESNAKLQERNRTKWATLGPDGPTARYRYYALTADSSVTRVKVNDRNPRGPGTIDIYLAGANGSVIASVITAVSDYILGNTDGVGRRGLCMNLEVTSAVNLVVPIAGTVYMLAEYDTIANRQKVRDAIDAYFRTVPIGGTKNDVSGPGFLVFGELLKAILTAATGVVNAVLTAPTGDVELGQQQVAIPSYDANTLAFESVRTTS